MQNFEWETPTRVIFGMDVIDRLGSETRNWGKRALLVYGKNSIKSLGLYSAIVTQLENQGIHVVEHGGVKPNPILSHAEEGIRIARESGVDVIVAAGGGSVIDESKAIAIGALHEERLWDFYTRQAVVRRALPVVAIQTLPATSSETNGASVMTNDATGEKFSVRSIHIYPKVAFLDPQYTLSIPLQYTAYACTDIMAHLMEGYFTAQGDYPLQDGMVEGVCRSIIWAMDRLMADSRDLEARSTLMWAGALAWNGLLKCGVTGADIPNHMIEHPLSGLYDITHGAGLSIVIPAWLKYKKNQIAPRILKFGETVLRLGPAWQALPEARRVDETIQALESWYRSIRTPISLSQAGITNADVEKMVAQALRLGAYWGVQGYTAEDIRSIYKLCQ